MPLHAKDGVNQSCIHEYGLVGDARADHFTRPVNVTCPLDSFFRRVGPMTRMMPAHSAGPRPSVGKTLAEQWRRHAGSANEQVAPFVQ